MNCFLNGIYCSVSGIFCMPRQFQPFAVPANVTCAFINLCKFVQRHVWRAFDVSAAIPSPSRSKKCTREAGSERQGLFSFGMSGADRQRFSLHLEVSCMSCYRLLWHLKSTNVSVCFRGISPLPSAFVFLRWFKLAYISIQICTFHDGCKQGIDQQIFNRKSISRKITHPQSLFK